MLAHYSQKSNRFVQFYWCNSYNIDPILSLFYFVIHFVVDSTTIVAILHDLMRDFGRFVVDSTTSGPINVVHWRPRKCIISIYYVHPNGSNFNCVYIDIITWSTVLLKQKVVHYYFFSKLGLTFFWFPIPMSVVDHFAKAKGRPLSFVLKTRWKK